MNGKNNVVFLFGAGRSGTILFYKILSTHRSVAYSLLGQDSASNDWSSPPGTRRTQLGGEHGFHERGIAMLD